MLLYVHRNRRTSTSTFSQLPNSEAALIIFQPTSTRRILVVLFFPGAGNLHYNFSAMFDNLMVIEDMSSLSVCLCLSHYPVLFEATSSVEEQVWQQESFHWHKIWYSSSLMVFCSVNKNTCMYVIFQLWWICIPGVNFTAVYSDRKYTACALHSCREKSMKKPCQYFDTK